MKIKPSFEYHLWFLLTLIAAVLSAFIIPNPWLRAGGVALFSIMCHLFGQKEGDIAARADEAAKAEATKSASSGDEGSKDEPVVAKS